MPLINRCGNLSAKGDALLGDVLTGKTFSGAAGIGVPGSMPNQGAVAPTISTQGGTFPVPAGYHNGGGVVTANFANLTAGNIKQGVNAGGVVGTLVALASVNWAIANVTTITYSASGSITLSNHPKLIIAVTATGASYEYPTKIYLISGSTVTVVTTFSQNGTPTGGNITYDENTKLLTYTTLILASLNRTTLSIFY